MHRFPHGVAVVAVETGGQQVGLTVSSLTSLSLDPPLLGFAVARQAAMHELLLTAGAFSVSLLAEGQDRIAEHFARGVPPLVHWLGIDVVPAVDGPPLIAGAIGWIRADVAWYTDAGTHTFVAGAVTWTAAGPGGRALVRAGGTWGAV
jgi:3-hydroxy-9,10-secoandrosta-1,3,5(10)-triene-9,17-dione monooxygenase reductase component